MNNKNNKRMREPQPTAEDSMNFAKSLNSILVDSQADVFDLKPIDLLFSEGCCVC
jgi:hypothetical protein